MSRFHVGQRVRLITTAWEWSAMAHGLAEPGRLGTISRIRYSLPESEGPGHSAIYVRLDPPTTPDLEPPLEAPWWFWLPEELRPVGCHRRERRS